MEDGRIGTKVASHDSIYFERGWELFSALRIFHGFYITNVYKIVIYSLESTLETHYIFSCLNCLVPRNEA